MSGAVLLHNTAECALSWPPELAEVRLPSAFPGIYGIKIQSYPIVKTGIPLHPARPATPMPALRSVRLLDQVRERIRYLHYSIRTEDA
jgi:hypothetical protein